VHHPTSISSALATDVAANKNRKRKPPTALTIANLREKAGNWGWVGGFNREAPLTIAEPE
jgi:hypothetical protein